MSADDQRTGRLDKYQRKNRITKIRLIGCCERHAEDKVSKLMLWGHARGGKVDLKDETSQLDDNIKAENCLQTAD